ncbi:MAG TPA: response regulator [bacterium]|nr:response regulator [bacterium]
MADSTDASPGGKQLARIAVVDDNEDVVTLLGEVLRRDDYIPDLFSSSREAMLAATSQEYDLIICDLQMPEVTGMDLLTKVKATFPRTEFIMITGYASVKSAVEAMHRGAVSYLAKPLTSTQIIAHVEKALERRILALENTRLIYELTGANEALENKVGELKHLNELLRQTQADLVKAERLAAIGEVVVSINHSINNSIAAIRAATRFLRNLGGHPAGALDTITRIDDECCEIESILGRLRCLREPAAVDYVDGIRMIGVDGGQHGVKV